MIFSWTIFKILDDNDYQYQNIDNFHLFKAGCTTLDLAAPPALLDLLFFSISFFLFIFFVVDEEGMNEWGCYN